MAIKVSLRQKKISKGRQTLYLDFYPAIIDPRTGDSTRRQFLKMYIYDSIRTLKRKQKDGTIKEIPVFHETSGLNDAYKVHNEDTIHRAEIIRLRRDNEVNKQDIYNEFEKEQLRTKAIGEKNFLEFFKDLADVKKTSNHDNWISTYNYLKTFTGGKLMFSELNEGFCDEFKAFLLSTNGFKRKKSTLSRNTCASYYNKFKEALKLAYRKGLLQVNINEKVDRIQTEVPFKNTLTIDELNKLAKTECPSTILRKATFFFALTGLPFKEMQELTWGEIHTTDTGDTLIQTTRHKTKKDYQVYIGDQALSLLGKRKDNHEKVFEDLTDTDRYENFQLWLAAAGITKKMTFHDLRHTYATNQVDAGTGIYTLKGNMAHSDVRYTQRYAKGSSKREKMAAEIVKLDL